MYKQWRPMQWGRIKILGVVASKNLGNTWILKIKMKKLGRPTSIR